MRKSNRKRERERGKKMASYLSRKPNNSGNKLRSERTEKCINIFSSLLCFFSPPFSFLF